MKYVLFLGFNYPEIENCLKNKDIDKVIIFDNSYTNRDDFEKLYKEQPSNKDRITMYEGCITTNIETYLKQHKGEFTDYCFSGDMHLLYLCNQQDNDRNGVHDKCVCE